MEYRSERFGIFYAKKSPNLHTKSKKEKLERGMDMIEVSIREKKGRDSFRLDCCIEAIEASVDVSSGRKKVFNVTRQYSYI